MATTELAPAAVIAAIFDDPTAAMEAADAVEASAVAVGNVHRLVPGGLGPKGLGLGGTGDKILAAAGVPSYAIERYGATLCRGRTLVLVETCAADATAVDWMLREHRPVETAVHCCDRSGRDGHDRVPAGEDDDPLPASIQSTAALNPRPRGRRDPIA